MISRSPICSTIATGNCRWPTSLRVLWPARKARWLFWSLLLATYGLCLALRYKTDQRLFANASVVLAGVQVFSSYSC